MTVDPSSAPSTLTQRLAGTVAPFVRFFDGPVWARYADPDVANLAVGNPQEFPLPAYVGALERALTPQDKDWFAYKMSEPRSRAIVARTLTARTGLDYDPLDIQMTNGGFAAIAVTLRAIVEPGDEVIFLSPPWFFYELLIVAAGGDRGPGHAGGAGLRPGSRGDRGRDHPTDASGHREHAAQPERPGLSGGRPRGGRRRPGGRVAARTAGRSIWSPTSRTTASCSTGGRSTARPRSIRARSRPTHTARLCSRRACASGTSPCRRRHPTARRFANRCSSHRSRPATRSRTPCCSTRSRISSSCRSMSGRSNVVATGSSARCATRAMRRRCPRARSTSWPRRPIPDDEAFSVTLAEHGVLVLPGTVVELPGWFRISLTASERMIDTAIRGFAAARDAQPAQAVAAR